MLILDHDRPETAEEEEEEEYLPNDFEPEEVNRGGSDDEEKVVLHAQSPIAMSSSQPNQDLCSRGCGFDCELLSVLVLSFHMFYKTWNRNDEMKQNQNHAKLTGG